MVMLKKLVCITLFISVIMFPTSAFASKDKDHDSGRSQKSSKQTVEKFFSFFTSNHGNHDFKDFWDDNRHDIKDDIKDWYERNKYHQPNQDSYDIWKDWYCN
jgi:hypothetical protein